MNYVQKDHMTLSVTFFFILKLSTFVFAIFMYLLYIENYMFYLGCSRNANILKTTYSVDCCFSNYVEAT